VWVGFDVPVVSATGCILIESFAVGFVMQHAYFYFVITELHGSRFSALLRQIPERKLRISKKAGLIKWIFFIGAGFVYQLTDQASESAQAMARWMAYMKREYGLSRLIFFGCGKSCGPSIFFCPNRE
jgi:hypothetical protein